MKSIAKINSHKKLVCLFAGVILLIISLTGCGNKEVELTADNINDYLQFNLTYENFDTHTSIGLPFAFTDVVLEAYPTASGQLDNVNIKAELTCPDGWTFVSGDSANTETGATLEVEIVMPSDGKYTSTYRIGRVNYRAEPDADCTINITEASGTFTKD